MSLENFMLFILSLALVTQILAAVCKTRLNEMLDWLLHIRISMLALILSILRKMETAPA